MDHTFYRIKDQRPQYYPSCQADAEGRDYEQLWIWRNRRRKWTGFCLFSCIYMHYVLVWWFKEVITPKLKGYAGLVVYADDCAPRRRKLVTWCQTSIAMLCEWWWQAHRNRYIGGGFKSLWGAVVKSYGTERQRKGCTKQSGVDSGDERSCEPLTKTSKA